jgi:hypothetical protein
MAPQDVADGLISHSVTQVGQSSYDPIVSPAGVFASHLHDQRLNLRVNSGPSGIAAVLGSVEFAHDPSSVPSQYGVRLGYSGHLGQGLAPESSTNLGERGPLRIGQAQSSR